MLRADWVRLQLFEQLSHLYRLWSHGGYFGLCGRRGRTDGTRAVTESDVRRKKRKVRSPLALGLNGVFALGITASRRWILILLRRRWRVLRSEQACLLRERALCHKLLPLQFLDAALQLGDFGLVDLNRSLDG